MKSNSFKIYVYLRRFLATVSLLAMASVFFVPAAARWFGWLPRLQLVPAILAGAVLEIVVLGVFVALFGRLYCSILCPLGILQDFFSAGRRGCLPNVDATSLPRQETTSVRRRMGWLVLRYAVLVLFIVGVFFGLTGLIEPYGIFGRFLAVGIRRVGEPDAVTIVWALGLVAFILAMTFVHPRWWCNRVCPVGTFLGIFSCISLFRVRVDSAKCVKCGICAKHCEVGALSVRADRTIAIDHSSCVMCGNCLAACAKGALSRSIL